jgi:hypothetical protein
MNNVDKKRIVLKLANVVTTTLQKQEEPISLHWKTEYDDGVNYASSDNNTGCFLIKWTHSRLCTSSQQVQPPMKRTQILPMTQHAENSLNEEKFLPLYTDHRRC